MAKDQRSSIKDEDTYDALREQGTTKEKAARIANARADPDRNPFRKGGNRPPYEEWSKGDLYDRAKEIGIEGRYCMTKGELIGALRDH